MPPPYLQSQLLNQNGARHAFFGRAGGVSKGIYASLNTGRGSDDDADDVTENRRRCADALDVDERRLITHYQIHSATVLTVRDVSDGPPVQADAAVTDQTGIALGVLAADCMPWLFHDPSAKVIGAAHAGWRGALDGVLQNTISAMESLGATPQNITAAVGPCLRQPNFEVGGDLVEVFQEKYADIIDFLQPGARPEKRLLDLIGFASQRLREAGVTKIDIVGPCTLANDNSYFSYRGARRRGETDYGRNLSAIVLT